MTDCPVFGREDKGRDYRPRTGVYALIRSAAGRLALVKGRSGRYFLPGGGANAGEDHADTLRREVMEECGWRVEIGRKAAEARQFVAAPGEGHFLLHCHYYEAAMLARTDAEPEHLLEWATREECARLLHRECDRWATTQLG